MNVQGVKSIYRFEMARWGRTLWQSLVTPVILTNGDRFEIVYPSVSILAEPPVALVERNVRRRGTGQLARGYVDFLFGANGQAIAAKHYFRTAAGTDDLPEVRLFTVDEVFGGWEEAHRVHFAEGGLFDQLFMERFN